MAEKVNSPSGSSAGSPVLVRVVREERPLSRREGDEVMKRRLGGESRSQLPPPFELFSSFTFGPFTSSSSTAFDPFQPSPRTVISTETDAETATATAGTWLPTLPPPFPQALSPPTSPRPRHSFDVSFHEFVSTQYFNTHPQAHLFYCVREGRAGCVTLAEWA